jgi:hypothetical protein
MDCYFSQPQSRDETPIQAHATSSTTRSQLAAEAAALMSFVFADIVGYIDINIAHFLWFFDARSLSP